MAKTDTSADRPYQVYNRDGLLMMSGPEKMRYKKKTELNLLEAGYTIKLHGKKLTKKEINER